MRLRVGRDAPDDSPPRPPACCEAASSPAAGPAGPPQRRPRGRQARPVASQPPCSSRLQTRRARDRRREGRGTRCRRARAAGEVALHVGRTTCATVALEVLQASATSCRAAPDRARRRRHGGATRQRLEPERAAAGVQVQAPAAGDVHLQPVEQRLADPVRSRANRLHRREVDLAAAPFATDDAQQQSAPWPSSAYFLHRFSILARHPRRQRTLPCRLVTQRVKLRAVRIKGIQTW